MKSWDFIGGAIGLLFSVSLAYMIVGFFIGSLLLPYSKSEECGLSQAETYSQNIFFWPKHFWAERYWYCKDKK